MAKKRSQSPTKKSTAKTSTTPGAKKVSVKQILAEIDKALKALETNTIAVKEPSREIERARKALGAARNAVESTCLPEFYLPSS